MSGPWEIDGQIIESGGAPVECADCPCDADCECCETGTAPSPLQVALGGTIEEAPSGAGAGFVVSASQPMLATHNLAGPHLLDPEECDWTLGYPGIEDGDPLGVAFEPPDEGAMDGIRLFADIEVGTGENEGKCRWTAFMDTTLGVVCTYVGVWKDSPFDCSETEVLTQDFHDDYAPSGTGATHADFTGMTWTVNP